MCPPSSSLCLSLFASVSQPFQCLSHYWAPQLVSKEFLLLNFVFPWITKACVLQIAACYHLHCIIQVEPGQPTAPISEQKSQYRLSLFSFPGPPLTLCSCVHALFIRFRGDSCFLPLLRPDPCVRTYLDGVSAWCIRSGSRPSFTPMPQIHLMILNVLYMKYMIKNCLLIWCASCITVITNQS